MPNKPKHRSTKRRPNTANTIAGGNNPVPPVPPFHSRKTLAEYVHDSMHFANRLTLKHRIGLLANNCPTKSREELKHCLENIFLGINLRAKTNEQISGVCLIYPAHTFMLLAAPDRTFGLFKDNYGQMFGSLFLNGRLLYFHGNVNKVDTEVLNRCIWLLL